MSACMCGMASLAVVVYRLSGFRQRLTFQEVPLTALIGTVKSKIVSSLSEDIEGDIDVIIGGRELQDEQSLEACNVTPGTTLIAIERLRAASDTDVACPPIGGGGSSSGGFESSPQVAEALLYLGAGGPYRALLEDVVADLATLESLKESIAELGQDVVAQAVLREPDMLAVLTDPQQAERLFARHGCLRAAVVMMGAKVKEKAVAAGIPLPGAAHRSRRQPAVQAPTAGGSRVLQQHLPASAPVITTSQLSAALAAAAGASLSRSPAQQQPSSSGVARQQAAEAAAAAAAQPISQDFFAQALQRAHEHVHAGSGGAAAAGNSAPAGGGGIGSSSRGGGGSGSAQGRGRSVRYLESQIRQLRDMGIDDEALARRALTAADGNIALALELIYGDGAD